MYAFMCAVSHVSMYILVWISASMVCVFICMSVCLGMLVCINEYGSWCVVSIF